MFSRSRGGESTAYAVQSSEVEKILKEEVENISITNICIKRIHWANRDFSEYKEAA